MGSHAAVPELLPHIDDARLPRAVGHEALGHADVTGRSWEIAARLRDQGEHDGVAYEMDRLAEHSREKVITSINEVRDRIARLAPEDKAVVSGYLAGYFTEVDPADTGHRNLAEWFADGRHGASNRLALTFFDEHRREVALQSQRPEAKEAIERMKQQRRQAEREGVLQRWVSPNVLKSQYEVDDMHVVIGDIFDTTLSDKHGYTYLDADWVVLAQSGRTLKERAQHLEDAETKTTYHHEANHLRFDSRLPTLAKFRKEGLSEHEALTFQHGGEGIQIMHPDDRRRAGFEDGSYAAFRAVMAVELSAGRHRIDPRVATLAHTSGSEDSPEFQLYDRMLDESWGMKGFRKWVDDLVGRRHVAAMKRIRGVSPRTALQIAAREVETDLFNLSDHIEITAQFADRT